MYKPGMILVKKKMNPSDIIQSIKLIKQLTTGAWSHEIVSTVPGHERHIGLKIIDSVDYLLQHYVIKRNTTNSFIAYNYKNKLVKR